MESYEVTQVLMSVGTTYEVRRPKSQPVLFTIRGELMSPVPKFHLAQGTGEASGQADLVGNFIKTKYEILIGGASVALMVFPAVAFKKTLTLTVGTDVYEADGGVFKGIFQCKNEKGELVLEIAKELSIRDTFLVKRTDQLPLEVGLLSAVAIHSRFYELV
jgi:uncharacterized protein YxjI